MPVELITDGLVLQPNHVFIIPAQRDLHVLHFETLGHQLPPPAGVQSPSL
jgi:two-component system, chemotaxis family, protein-glutamate methylesterase/glutaminase